jgi:hypothetical protein
MGIINIEGLKFAILVGILGGVIILILNILFNNIISNLMIVVVVGIAVLVYRIKKSISNQNTQKETK